MDLKSLQVIELNILDEVHNFCCENHLTYWLFYGTLLGAVRHNGFIPWDDDIDIAMPRLDYEKFIERFNQSNKTYQVISCRDEGYMYPFAKVYDKKYPIREKMRFDCGIGIYIDIFPIDILPENIKEIKKMISHLWKYKILWSGATNINNVYSRNIFRRFFSKIYDREKTNNLIRKMDLYVRNKSEKYTGNDQWYMSFSVCHNKYEHFLEEDFNPVLHIFEDKQYYIPSGFDTILRTLYGDYLQLPREEERIPSHDFDVIEKMKTE